MLFAFDKTFSVWVFQLKSWLMVILRYFAFSLSGLKLILSYLYGYYWIFRFGDAGHFAFFRIKFHGLMSF